MAKQQVYTSVPEGIWPNSNGYCTVLCTEGIPRTVADMLEAFSVYRIVDKGPDGTISPTQENYQELIALNPPSLCHISFKFRRDQIHVMMKTCLAGFDYSGRLRKMTHFLVLDESDKKSAGPAWMLRQPGVTLGDWGGKPTMLTDDKVLPEGESPARPCKAWEAATGDAGWAGVLADTVAGSYRRIAYIVYTQDMDAPALLEEALALLPPEKRWEATFSTNFTRLPQNIECQWRFTLADSPEVALAMRRNDLLVLDLTTNLRAPADSDAVEAAREGRQLKVATVQRGSAITGIRRLPDAEELATHVEEVNFSEIETQVSEPVASSAPQASFDDKVSEGSNFESPPPAPQTTAVPPTPPPSPAPQPQSRVPAPTPIPLPPAEPPASSGESSFATFYIAGGIVSLLLMVSLVVVTVMVLKSRLQEPPVLSAPQPITLAPGKDRKYSATLPEPGLINVASSDKPLRVCLPNGETIPNSAKIDIPLHKVRQNPVSADQPPLGLLTIFDTGAAQFSIAPDVFRKFDSKMYGEFEYAVCNADDPKVISSTQILRIEIAAAPETTPDTIPNADAVPPLAQIDKSGETIVWTISESSLRTYFPKIQNGAENTEVRADTSDGGVGSLKKVNEDWIFKASRSQIEESARASKNNEFGRIVQFLVVDTILNRRLQQMGVKFSLQAPQLKDSANDPIVIDTMREERRVPLRVIEERVRQTVMHGGSDFDIWFGKNQQKAEEGQTIDANDDKTKYKFEPVRRGPMAKQLILTLQTPPEELPESGFANIDVSIGISKSISEKVTLQIPLPKRPKAVVEDPKPENTNPPAEVPLVEKLIEKISPGNTWRRTDSNHKFHVLDIGDLAEPIVWATFDPEEAKKLELSFEVERVEDGYFDDLGIAIEPSETTKDAWVISYSPNDFTIAKISFERESGKLEFVPRPFESSDSSSSAFKFLGVHAMQIKLKQKDLESTRVFQFHQPTLIEPKSISLPEFKSPVGIRIVTLDSPWTRADINSLSPVMVPEEILPTTSTLPKEAKAPRLQRGGNIGFVSLAYGIWKPETSREENGFEPCVFGQLKERCSKLRQLKLEERGDDAMLERYEKVTDEKDPIKFTADAWILSSKDSDRQILLAAPAKDRIPIN